MIRLKAAGDLLQIIDGTAALEQALELANPTVWVRTMARQQKQAERDLRQLTKLCGNMIDKIDQRMVRIE